MRRLSLLSSVLLLVGCAQIPTSLDVRSGPEIASQGQAEVSYYTPAGPTVGATQQEIVSGFLAAGTGPQNDYAVARQFLSSQFAQRWKPDAGVLIRSGGPVFRESGSTLQMVTISVVARVDDQGRYQDAPAADQASLRFQLVQEDGEWRISSAPNLTVVTPPVFSVVFKPLSLYFFDSQQRRLVSDLRWFPTRTSTGTRLVNALLQGPSSWLEPGVVSAIPAGTKLTVEAVRIQNGVAEVDFDATALAADSLTRRLMLSQLRATLLQLNGVNDVLVSVNNSVQEITPAAVIPVQSSADASVLTNDGLLRLSAVTGQPAPGTASLVSSVDPYLFASKLSTNRQAFATNDGVYLLYGGTISTRSEKVSDATDLAALGFDPEGLLWLIPKQSGAPIAIYRDQELVAQVVLPALGTRRAAEISPEGSRIAVVLESESGSRLELFSISKDVRLIPSTINQGKTMNLSVGAPLSVTWQNQNVIRILERTAAGVTVISEYPVVGPRTQLPVPPVRGVKLTAGQTAFNSYLLSDDQEVWLFNSGTWRRVAAGAKDIATVR